MKEYARPGLFEGLAEKTELFCAGLRELFPEALVASSGGMFSVGFGVGELRDHRDAQRLDKETFARFFHAALAEGVYFPPSTWDAASLSTAHSRSDLEEALARLQRAKAAMRR
jgi:glutamate-1-semialdehyde 2,1-aminomutase